MVRKGRKDCGLSLWYFRRNCDKIMEAGGFLKPGDTEAGRNPQKTFYQGGNKDHDQKTE